MKLAKTKICQYCNGSGRTYDSKIVGAHLRESRKRAKISLRGMAKYLGITPGYLCHLELGRRNWHTDRIAQYLHKKNVLRNWRRNIDNT